MKRAKTLTALVLALLTGGCKNNPVERLADPLSGGVVPQSSGVYTIYDEELKTGGGLAFIPGGENQSIELDNRDEPRRTANQIKYVWNGGNVTFNGEPQHLFAGFHFFVTPDQASAPLAGGKDLSGFGYTKLTFFIRGTLSQDTILRVQGPSTGAEPDDNLCIEVGCEEYATLSGDWEKKEILISTNRLSNVKFFVTFSLQYQQPPRTDPPGSGGVIYLDDIRYE